MRTRCDPRARSGTEAGVTPASRPSTVTRAPEGVERISKRPGPVGVAASGAFAFVVSGFGRTDGTGDGKVAARWSARAAGFGSTGLTALSVNSCPAVAASPATDAG